MGHIVDMSKWAAKDPSIPEVPVVNTEMLKEGIWVEIILLGEKIIVHPDNDLFVCKAGEFNNIPEVIITTPKNKAILNLTKALSPSSLVIIHLER